MKKTISEIKFNSRRRLEYNYPRLIAATVLVGLVSITIMFVVYVIQVMNMDMAGIFNATLAQDTDKLIEIMDKTAADPFYLLITVLSSLIASVITEIAITGFKKMVLTVARGGRPDLSELFFPIFNNPDKIVILSAFVFAFFLLTQIPDWIISFMASGDGSAGTVMYMVIEAVLFILYIAVTLFVSQAEFLYIDDPEKSVKELVTESAALMRGNVLRYILLNLSFILWYLVAFFTFGAAFIIVIPYHCMAMAVFYRDLRQEMSGQGS
ncbi:MAG: DUF975 family protein [Lachnospiraceae bacterium]|nr:DUF975 family protein [Lachnospiraceae bacterium]